MDRTRSDAERKREKELRYLRARGIKTQYVGVERAKQHIEWLKSTGMSARRIHEIAGVSESIVAQIVLGQRNRADIKEAWPVTRIHRDTEKAILTVQPEAVPERGGARVSSLASRRRLQALHAEGFTTPVIARAMGIGAHQPIYTLMMGQTCSKYVYAATAHNIKTVYDRMAGQNPTDFGQTSTAGVRARNNARRKDWAPSLCWDDDTIDDPDAIPEWTGACGTTSGYERHKVMEPQHEFLTPYQTERSAKANGSKYKTSIACKACREANQASKTGGVLLRRGKQHDETTLLIVKHLREGDMPVKDIADSVGVDKFRVYYVRKALRSGFYDG